MCGTLNNPNRAEKRFSTEVRPFTALAATTQFLMDVEQTHHVFRLTDAIDSAQNEKNFLRFMNTEVGQRLNAEQFDLTAYLSNRARLEAYPAGSVGRGYIEFLDRENLDLGMLLSAEQVAERAYSHLDEPRRKFIAAGTANHDLLHILTGYGREPLGEGLLLAFSGAAIRPARHRHAEPSDDHARMGRASETASSSDAERSEGDGANDAMGRRNRLA